MAESSPPPAADANFQVNLGGLIDILANHLYSGPRVYLRELLQNAVDATRAREARDPLIVDQSNGSSANSESRVVRFNLVTPASGAPTLVVEDNGIGLTRDDVMRFLATVGMSSKQKVLSGDVDYIGRFGIGLLSCFMVCDEIVVVSRTLGDDAETIRWVGRDDGTYRTSVIDTEAAVGTQVFIRGRVDTYEFFDPDFVRQTLRRYGEFLGIPIEFSHDGVTERLDARSPWEDTPTSDDDPSGDAPRDAFDLSEASKHLKCPLMTQFDVAVPSVGLNGKAYVTAESSAMATPRPHTIYLKGMLLSDSVDNLLPDWAFFMRVIANVDGLQPTASRESFVENHDFVEARTALAKVLRQRLVDMAEDHPDDFRTLLAMHHAAIKTLCVEDRECLELFADWLPFETTEGVRTLESLRKRGQTLRYVDTVDEYRSIAAIMRAQDQTLINAGYTHDSAVLDRLAQMDVGVPIERFDWDDLSSHFAAVEPSDQDAAERLAVRMTSVLQAFECGVEVVRFEPTDLPAVYISNTTGSFLKNVRQTAEDAQRAEDDLWSDVLGQIADNITAGAVARLYVNWQSDLIQRLADISDGDLCRSAVELVYAQALLQGNHRMNAAERALLQSATMAILDHAI